MTKQTEEEQTFRQHGREWLKNDMPSAATMRLPQSPIGLGMAAPVGRTL